MEKFYIFFSYFHTHSFRTIIISVSALIFTAFNCLYVIILDIIGLMKLAKILIKNPSLAFHKSHHKSHSLSDSYLFNLSADCFIISLADRFYLFFCCDRKGRIKVIFYLDTVKVISSLFAFYSWRVGHS